jgi:RNA polymerase-binding protein DksA
MSLSPSQLSQCQQQLEQQLSALTESVESHRTHHTDGGVHIRTHRGETDDDAVVEEMNQLEIGALQRGTEAIHDVQAALARLAAGTYGVCAACGEDIAPQRLAVAPAARMCMTCATAAGK